MVNSTEWLEQNYPTNGTCTRKEDIINYGKRRSEVRILDISDQNLEGDLGNTDTNVYYKECLFPNLIKADFSSNQISNVFWIKSCNSLEEYDYSNNSYNSYDGSWGVYLNSVFSNSFKKLNLSNNRISNISFQAPKLSHLDVSRNLLTKLDLSVSGSIYVENLQFLDCSNNPGLVNLTLPSSSNSLSLNCHNTNLGNITFSNSSVFDCETGKFILDNTTSTTTSTPTTIPTTVFTVTVTSQPTNDLPLNLGLGLGIPAAVILLGLASFFGYKWKIIRQAVPTAGSS